MSALWLALVLILPISALVARRLPVSRVAVLALAWLAIFVVVVVIVQLIQTGGLG